MTSKKVCFINNNYYLYERESYWDPILKKSRQRKSTLVGKCDKDGNLIAPAKKRMDYVNSTFPVGPLSIFYATAKELELKSHIEDVIDVESDMASNILCLVLNQIVSRRPVEKLDTWVLRNPIVKWEDLDPKNINREAFGKALSNLCTIYQDGSVEDYGLALQYEMSKVWNDKDHEPAQFYYDVTKQRYYGTKSFYGEPGYIPGGTNKNVVGFGLVTSRTHHYPILCRPIRGSKHDTITVQDTVNTLDAWGFEDLTLILDRGMVSKENIKFIMDSGYNQVGIVPETNKDVWKYITKWTSEEITKPQYLVARPSGETVYLKGWTAPLLGRQKMKLAVVEDPKRKLNEQIGRDQLLRELEGIPSKKRLKEIKTELGKQVIIVKGRRGFKVDQKKVKENKKGDGRFLMFSTDLKMNTEEMFFVYFQRDVVEKAFCTLKGELRLGPIRYRRRDRIDAYSTIVYLAYLLWSWTERKLKKKYPNMSLTEVLELVEDVSWIEFKSGKLYKEWVTRLTNEQTKMLKYLGAIQFLPVS